MTTFSTSTSAFETAGNDDIRAPLVATDGRNDASFPLQILENGGPSALRLRTV